MIAPSGPCRFTLRGDLDLATATELEARLMSLPTETSVVLDVSGLSAMDPGGLEMLVRAAEHLDAVVILEAPTDDVVELLETTPMSWRDRVVLRRRRPRGPRSTPTRRHRGPLLDWS